MFVMTIDQRGSRQDTDRVDWAISRLERLSWVRRPERTAGDELQAVAGESAVVVDAVLDLIADGHWSVGIGTGPVDEPLPRSTRAGRGRAFEAARDAVEAAKSAPVPVQVRGTSPAAAGRAEAMLSVLGLIVARRTAQGREVVALMDEGITQSVAAERLGISRQAVSQRLAAAGYTVERPARDVAAYLLREADS
ncbi:hypothetical protein P0W64_08880 [Tsukamurella sp. 8F]|uniref:hypothetical protein n=1 Tax=unclassified Tsukamurella TaxID=2633480 RepID=UPI0023B95070|nr:MULTISPECIES: hypothetical protein [unclassified Tsukamurella]MDF0529279.1 hypothetical protein [Tsukamurella sp. 8J]MDF0586884.1 hypothetical protein [Tsukamurella sp. 8F]